MVTAAANIIPESVEWLWDLRLPLHGLALLAGEPGLGKSTLTVELAARVTRGELEGQLHGQPRDVLIATAEDHFASVVLGRLMAAGADLERVHRVHVEDPDGTGLTLPDDVQAIREHCGGARAAGRPVALVIADPIGAFIGADVDTHRDAAVRRVLAPLASLAEDEHLAVLGVAHLNKDQAGRLLNRVGGSVAFGAAPRSVLAFARHPDDPDGEEGIERVVVHCKTNHGVYAPTLAARVEGREIAEVGSVSRLVITGESDVGADDLQRGRDDHSGADVEEAVAAALANGPLPSRDVKGQVIAELGCGRRTVERVAERMASRHELSIKSGGFPRGTRWSLTVAPPPVAPLDDAEGGATGGTRIPEPKTDGADSQSRHVPRVGATGADQDLFEPDGDATCGDCGALLTAFGGQLLCVGCTSGKGPSS